jgi:G:T-mismatch repair DNA endonuclease (very short patch repair protein)
MSRIRGHRNAANKARDKLVNRTLRKAGWRVVRVWEHDLRPKNEARLIARIRKALNYSREKAQKSQKRASKDEEI